MSRQWIEWYEGSAAGQIPWEQAQDADYVKSYLLPMMTEEPSRYVQNVQTQMHALRLGDRIMPVTVNDTEYDNSYVSSVFTHYVTYAKEELSMLDSGVLRRVLSIVLTGLGRWMKKSQCNQMVIVNNWLLSTNLYHDVSADEVKDITENCIQKFSGHIIAFRSVCRRLYPDFHKGLVEKGYLMVPSRYVYLFHPDWPAQGRWRVRNTLNRDRKMLAKSGYRILRHEELGEQHAERIVALYNALYLDKYSQHNPQFSVEFVRLAMQKRTLTLIGLEKDGRLDGILGYFERNGVMTTPLFGYDTTLPKETGLYRMLSCLLVLEAESKGILLHQSAGVGAFKADRGAEGEPEYTAVYVKHLPFYRQAVWKVLAILLNRIGVKMVEKYQL
ncbi:MULTISPECIES: GNAT family N-acetyltransferase [Brevibacillus]|uniref:GNAT family N-acetyltransferase n=1 Tax=Brevibacillus TaxID=55080 RepID=UPI0018EB4746|nr:MULTISPECIES: GNAT family N-acetyltransferase [Brevibacillus]MED1945611.1 GNAT family N-acetyltransferase [Brevibacillus formosus]MED2000756.1 GNAT family N-acetyltransferase [Brevibacillus formosus]MED2084398.1 GNAT family N-acetyltransferase [Brevibacillus formosus]